MSTENINAEHDTDRAMELVCSVEQQHKIFFEPGTYLWHLIIDDIKRVGYTKALSIWNENVRVDRNTYLKKGVLTIHPDAHLVWSTASRHYNNPTNQ